MRTMANPGKFSAAVAASFLCAAMAAQAKACWHANIRMPARATGATAPARSSARWRRFCRRTRRRPGSYRRSLVRQANEPLAEILAAVKPGNSIGAGGDAVLDILAI